MKLIDQLQYKSADTHRIRYILKKLQLTPDGRVIYKDGSAGSFAIELLMSIFAKPKKTKLVDEAAFIAFLREMKIPKKYLP